MDKVDSNRLMEAIGRDGSALSNSQENTITEWIEAETSRNVVPRDYRERCAVHFTTGRAEEKLRRRLEEAAFDYDIWKIAHDNFEVAGDGVIVVSDAISREHLN